MHKRTKIYFSLIEKVGEIQNASPGELTKSESFEGELALRYWVILGNFSSLLYKPSFSIFVYFKKKKAVILLRRALLRSFPSEIFNSFKMVVLSTQL